ncbi:hypothetical protein Zmor_005169 [Zophobas morio]|uniref:Uncharacterized protein n=1 Tax=Zophobas morio TaxID=2755281 RepID=A0AA38IMT0_9CUCU|nr:hypothetical protein Zmor_005169 [Zophobas morio]
MTEIHESSSASDISTDSWTLLEERMNIEEPSSDISSENNDEIIEIGPETADPANSPPQDVKKKKSDGFLTFDEYMQERLLEHDYEQEEKPQKLRKLYKEKLRRGFKKYKAQSLGISVFITIILALSAFATLCSTLSQPSVEKEVEIRYEYPLKRENSTAVNEVLERMNETMKDFEVLKRTKLLDLPHKSNSTKKAEPQKLDKVLIGPSRYNKTQTPIPKAHHKEQKEQKSPNPPLSKIFTSEQKCDASSNNLRSKIKAKALKTKWIILKEFLLDTNIHALISLVMTNIYLFTLLMDFARRPNKNCRSKCMLNQQLLEDLEKSNNIEELRKYLFRELPFWNAEFVPRDQRKKKLKINSTIAKTPKKTNSVAVFDQHKKMVNSILFRSCPFLNQRALSPLFIHHNTEETGKSECQRRFEELDQHQKKFESLKQAQKNRIKLLKQKFRNEVTFIKDNEEESEARTEKINRTSQMFIRKLKYNREKYLLELKKVRELRQKVSDSRKKESSKDVAVGSYSVSLPPIYDYGERFKLIKEKFERDNDQKF